MISKYIDFVRETLVKNELSNSSDAYKLNNEGKGNSRNMIQVLITICIISCLTIIVHLPVAFAETNTGKNNNILYATFSTYSNNIDFLFIADQSGKLLNARTIINSIGRKKFASTYLDNKNYYFADETGNLNTLSNIVFRNRLEEYGGPSLYGTDKIIGKKNYVGSHTYLALPFKESLIKIAEQKNDQEACKLLTNRSQKLSGAYFKKVLKLKKIKYPDSDNRLNSIESEGHYYADFDGDNTLDMVVAFSGKISTLFATQTHYNTFPSPVLIFVYGSGEKDIIEDVGHRVEQLNRITPIGLADLDNDNYLDVVISCKYYESNFYSAIKGNRVQNRKIFRTSTRCYDCSD